MTAAIAARAELLAGSSFKGDMIYSAITRAMYITGGCYLQVGDRAELAAGLGFRRVRVITGGGGT